MQEMNKCDKLASTQSSYDAAGRGLQLLLVLFPSRPPVHEVCLSVCVSVAAQVLSSVCVCLSLAAQIWRISLQPASIAICRLSLVSSYFALARIPAGRCGCFVGPLSKTLVIKC